MILRRKRGKRKRPTAISLKPPLYLPNQVNIPVDLRGKKIGCASVKHDKKLLEIQRQHLLAHRIVSAKFTYHFPEYPLQILRVHNVTESGSAVHKNRG